MEFFRSEQLFPGLIRIIDPSQTACYLAIGENRACLIDTGIGIGDLRTYVDHLTDLPYDVVLTHGHFDHASGAAQFADKHIYLHPSDKELMNWHTQPQKRLQYMRQVGGKADFTLSDLIPVYFSENTLPLTAGQIFDLGGLTLEAIHTPGHTHGMTMILMRELRTILFGDGCGVFVLLLEDCACTVEEYRNSLRSLKKYESLYDHILRQHGTFESPKELLDNVLECCDAVLEGTDDHQALDYAFVPGVKAFLAKKQNCQGRVDGKLGNLVYTPAKIR
ncbi:MAG: MBL fold metallo-hydrolase [Lachnospiraceae bacterium]|nr:MBL fold metallo-hydrolase [Lachnospiraceae bacterium]